MSNNVDLDYLENYMEKHLGINFDDPDFRLALRYLRELPNQFGYAERVELINRHAAKIFNSLQRADLKLILYNHALEEVYQENEMLDALRIYSAERIKSAEKEIAKLKDENERLKQTATGSKTDLTTT